MSEGGKITGTVVDAAGNLIEGIEIQAQALDMYGNPYSDPLGKTDANGRFLLGPMRIGEYRIHIAETRRSSFEQASENAKTKTTVSTGEVTDIGTLVKE